MSEKRLFIRNIKSRCERYAVRSDDVSCAHYRSTGKLKNKIVTQRSGHDFERRKTFAVEVDALARSPDIQRSFLSGGAAQI